MKYFLLTFLGICFLAFGVSGQTNSPPTGASRFFKEAGGLAFSEGNPDILTKVAGDKIDEVEGGGGTPDWTEIDGRVFATQRWMVEIGKIRDGYDLEKALAKAIQIQLESEGFKLTPSTFNFYSVRYQKGMTVGTLEVRKFFLGSGNLPLRMEFIFNESYQKRSRKKIHR